MVKIKLLKQNCVIINPYRNHVEDDLLIDCLKYIYILNLIFFLTAFELLHFAQYYI